MKVVETAGPSGTAAVPRAHTNGSASSEPTAGSSGHRSVAHGGSSFAPPPPPGYRHVRPQPTSAAEALGELTRVVPGARGALLASVDGFAIARSDQMPDEPAHAAMLAARFGGAGRLGTDVAISGRGRGSK